MALALLLALLLAAEAQAERCRLFDIRAAFGVPDEALTVKVRRRSDFPTPHMQPVFYGTCEPGQPCWECMTEEVGGQVAVHTRRAGSASWGLEIWIDLTALVVEDRRNWSPPPGSLTPLVIVPDDPDVRTCCGAAASQQGWTP